MIHLQDEPLQAAVRETYKDCPVVMKESLGRFIYELEETPSSVKPYYEFMSEFGILDISSTVRMLYSVSAPALRLPYKPREHVYGWIDRRVW